MNFIKSNKVNLNKLLSSDVWSPKIPFSLNKIIFNRSLGAHVYDVDNNQYIDFINGKGSITMGHNDKDIILQIINYLDNNLNVVTGPNQSVIDLSNRILGDVERDNYTISYFSTGTEAVKASIEMIKQATNKSLIISSGYHGWDPMWEQSNNIYEKNKYGIIDVFFTPELLKEAIQKYKGDIAAFIVSPDYVYLGQKTYNELFSLCKDEGIKIICDDVKQGYRYIGGTSLKTIDAKEDADIYIFSKGLSNGHRLSCVVGPEHYMKFLKDFTYTSYYDAIPYISSLSTLDKMEKEDGYNLIRERGNNFLGKLRKEIKKVGLNIEVNGSGNLFQFIFPNNEIENKFYRFSLLEGLLFFHGDNQCPSFSFTEEIYNDVLEKIKKVLLKLVEDNENLSEKNTISSERRFFSAWRQMDGAPDFLVDTEKIKLINRIIFSS